MIKKYIQLPFIYMDRYYRKQIVKTSGYLFCFLFNFRSLLRGKDVLFRYVGSGKYSVISKKYKRFFYSKSQNLFSFSNGISERAVVIGNDYMLDSINFLDGDVIIDCGANIGDLKLYFDESNIDIEYYGMGEKLDNPRGLPKKLNNCVFLFTHYFGKSNVPILKYIEQCADESVVIIEDCVQSCLSKNTGTKGDYLIHSLRKFLPVPDGAILESNTELDLSISKPNEEFISNKLISKLLKGFNIENDKEYLFYYKKGEEILDSKIIPREMSSFSKYIFSNINLNHIHKKRIKNWLALNEFFNKSSLNTKLLVSVYQNDKNINIPLTYPVKIQNNQRAKILKHLREKKVFCPIHWKLPKTNNKILLEDYKLSKEIFSIPIDQRLSTDDINSLINILISI